MPVPMDEFPVHQTPFSMRHVGTSDRNFYDRCYFNAFDPSGDVMLITGAGIYPNLGVKDAYALVRVGDEQYAVRMSDALDDDRLNQKIGPYRIEVIEPLEKVRVICDADSGKDVDGGTPPIGFDLTWEGSFPAVDEAHHYIQTGPRNILDTSRFAQVGSWSGTLRVAGQEYAVNPNTWLGSRDRSWGIRPVGETEPTGRWAEDEPTQGMYWLYVPMRFDDHQLMVMVQEKPDGYRTLVDATRTYADGRVEQLSWPDVDIRYRPGTRMPVSATLNLKDRSGKPITYAIETTTCAVLHLGAGYGAGLDWGHGMWKGRGWVHSTHFDLNDAEVAPKIPFGVIDHIGRATCDGRTGYGLFEHASIGRHDPSGFADFLSVAAG